MNGGKGHTGSAIHVIVEGGDAVDDVVVQSVRRTRKLLVESHDEVYYPTVTVVRKTAAQGQIDEVASTPMMNVINNTAASQKKQGARRTFSVLGTVMVTLVAVIALVLVGVRLAGFRTFTVMSGSMEPEYPVGSMIYVKPVNYSDLKVGDVISYVADDDKTVVTHRITEIEVDKKDASVWRFKTKGDANTTADAKLVHYKNVLGTPAMMIPFIGYVAHNIQQPPGIYIALVVGTLLLAWTFLPGTLEERRKTAKESVM